MALEDRIAVLRQKLANPPHPHWYKTWWGVLMSLLLFFLISFILASAAYVFKTASDINNNQNSLALLEKTQQERAIIEGQNNYYLGTTSPKVVIIEFSDFACPYCKASHEAVRELGLKYKNEIKIIYRDFLGHSNSLDLALAGRCAGEQNKFWAMHDKLFLNQDNITLSSLPILAQQIGVSTSTFNNCLKSQKYLPYIQADMAAAEKMKITATPTWIINGYLVKGTLDRDGLDSIIKEILNIK